MQMYHMKLIFGVMVSSMHSNWWQNKAFTLSSEWDLPQSLSKALH